MNPTGALWYHCACPVSHALRASIPTVRAAPTTSRAAVPISNPPKFHSKPGSGKVIFLDFNGATVTGTAWNNPPGEATYVAKPYSTDSDFTTFSDQEQANIKIIWERVAEDYAPFNVDVTTEQPTLGPNTAWAVITTDTDANGKALPHKGAGGVAFLKKFGQADFQRWSPAWVLDYGSDGASAAISDATSHEVGHNLGLLHDGNSTQAYEGGFPASATAPSWGPIMGAPYGTTVSHWSKGDYFQANNNEDDLAIITANLPWVTDDHGNSTNPSGLSLTAKAFSTAGVIGKTDDKDSFRISLGKGAMTATVTTYKSAGTATGGNLKAKLTLSTTAGAVVIASADSAQPDASIATTVDAGTYILTVEPLECGTPLTSRNGFNNYGTMGQYTLRGTGEPGAGSNSTDTGVGGTSNTNAGGQGNNLPGATYDGASQGDGGKSCGLGSSLGLLLIAGALLLGRLHLNSRR